MLRRSTLYLCGLALGAPACSARPLTADASLDGTLSDTPATDAASMDAVAEQPALDAPAPWDAATAQEGSPAAGNVRVVPGETSNAERIERLPIGTSAESAPRRVALHLGPAELPSLLEGDVLRTPAELEVTTACDVGQVGPPCGYSPTVAAQLLLADGPDVTDPSGPNALALSAVQRESVSSAEHHHTFAFRAVAAGATLTGASALPCLATASCHVNLVLWAWDPSARPGGADVLLVGENEGNFLANNVVQGDKARLMAIRERSITAADRRERETTGGADLTMPLDASGVLLYSQQLAAADGALEAGEQFYVEAQVSVTTSGRARFSSQLFLTHDPNASEGGSLNGTFPGAVSEQNGGNCTPGTSPCTSHRVAVFRVTQRVLGPVYVNLLGRSAVPGGGSATVRVRRSDGWLRSTRYGAELF